MPHKPHPCARPGCPVLVKRKEAVHCRKHAIKTPEHVEKVAAANRGRKFSAETRAKLSAMRRGDGEINRVCPTCSQPFTAPKPSSKVRFCSRACGYIQRQGERARTWRDDMPVITCRVCKKVFRARTTTVPQYTCSMFCKNAWQLKHQKKTGTNIERRMEEALKGKQWVYESQVPLCKIAIVDFYLPESKTVICCDGDYWHRLPENIAKDKRQTATLTKAGYTVHRFWGSEILADVHACLDRVKHLSPSGTSGT